MDAMLHVRVFYLDANYRFTDNITKFGIYRIRSEQGYEESSTPIYSKPMTRHCYREQASLENRKPSGINSVVKCSPHAQS